MGVLLLVLLLRSCRMLRVGLLISAVVVAGLAAAHACYVQLMSLLGRYCRRLQRGVAATAALPSPPTPGH